MTALREISRSVDDDPLRNSHLTECISLFLVFDAILISRGEILQIFFKSFFVRLILAKIAHEENVVCMKSTPNFSRELESRQAGL